jgi:membrane-associated phospholipid phosphatase
MPSDVLGGYLMATLWAALAVAALRFAERRWPAAHT